MLVPHAPAPAPRVVVVVVVRCRGTAYGKGGKRAVRFPPFRGVGSSWGQPVSGSAGLKVGTDTARLRTRDAMRLNPTGVTPR